MVTKLTLIYLSFGICGFANLILMLHICLPFHLIQLLSILSEWEAIIRQKQISEYLYLLLLDYHLLQL